MNICISSQDFHDFLINYISEIIAFFTTPAFYWIYKSSRKCRFKKVFGKQITNDYKLVYSQFILPQVYSNTGTLITHPYIKSTGNISASISNPVSLCETRALNYLVQCVSKRTKYAPEIVSDDAVMKKFDLSFCSLGGLTNFKSADVINSSRNRFFTFGTGLITNNKTKKQYSINNQHDYAVIIKIKSDFSRTKRYMCIAGLGEWGTSGAAYYISKNWSRIFFKTLFYSEFGALIEVQHGSDESARLIEILK